MPLGEETLPGNWNCESARWCRAASWEELAPISDFIDSTQNDVGFPLKAWTCHSHTKCFGVTVSRDLKDLSILVEFRGNQRRPSQLWEDKRVEPFSLKLFLKHLKTQHVAGGGGCLRTLDNLPGWSYGAVNSAIFEYYTKVARNPRSLLEPWRMSANDYQVHIYFSTYNIYIYMYVYYILYYIQISK